MNRSTGWRASSTWVGGGLSALLLVFAVAKGRGVLDASTELGLSGLVFLAGGIWALKSTARLERASELYLWLAFIVSVNHLQVFAQVVAAGLGFKELDVFRIAATLHVANVGAGLWVLGAWSRRDDGSLARLAAGLLIVGAVIFWIGARTFPGLALDQVHAHQAEHVWTSLNFVLATLITIAALALFTLAMREAGDRVVSTLALVVFIFGAVLWTLHLIVRLSVMVEAARQWSVSSVAPPWFEPWRLWAAWLFATYSVLAYISLAGYGGVLIRLGWVPRWAGWLCIGAGIIAAPLGGLPLFIHVPLWVVGILVLTHRGPHFVRTPDLVVHVDPQSPVKPKTHLSQ